MKCASIVVVVLFCATILFISMSGCSSQTGSQDPDSDPQDTTFSDKLSPSPATATISKEPTDLVLGTYSDGGYSITLTNGTNQSITGVSVCTSGNNDFSINLITPGASFAPNQVATLYTPVIEDLSSPETGIKLRAIADIQITFADGTYGVIHQLSVDNLKLVTVCCSEGIVYADYQIGDTTESTLETERALASTTSVDAP